MSFIAGYKVELAKLLAKKKYLVFFIISVLICAATLSSQIVIALISHEELSFRINNFPIMMLPFFAEILIPLIMFMAVSDLFGSEFADNTIKAMLLRPINRFKLMTAKLLACFSVAGILMLGVFFSATIIDLIVNGAGGFVKYFIFNLGSYIIDLLPMILLAIMAALINLVSKGTTLAMFLCILIYAVMKYCSYFIGITDGMLFTSYLQWHKLWIGNTIPFHALISKICLLIGYGTIMFSITYYIFDKKDI